MSAHVQPLPAVFASAYIRPAVVMQAAPNHTFRVRIEGREDMPEMIACLAMPVIHPIKEGDRVLVAGESPTSGYIIGMLDAAQQPAIRTPNGAGAKLEGRGPDQCIAVHDDSGRALFEYYPAHGRSVVKAIGGDLELDAPDGDIHLKAGKTIHCTSAEDVSIAGGNSVGIVVRGEEKKPDQEVLVDEDGVRMGVHKIDVSAGQSDVSIVRATYHGKQLTSRIERARLIYGKLDVTAKRIWQRSGHLFRQVRHLYQMQAGRLRTLVKGAHHSQSQRTTMIAKEDVRIDGKRINLG